jgi:urease beta subunit
MTYSLSTNPNGYYSIDESTGEVKLTQAGADFVNGEGNDLPDFTVTATSGGANGSTDDIDVRPNDTTPSNDAPELTDLDSTTFTIGEGAITLDSALTLSDQDNTHLTGATIKISSGYESGFDELIFTDMHGIEGSWNSATGELTLSGEATLEEYELALESIEYSSSTETEAVKEISWSITDTAGNESDIYTTNLTVQGEPSAGELSLSSATYTVNEDDGTITITVIRSGGSNGAVSVDYATSDGSAKEGSDYTSTSGTLNWEAGDTSPKTFTIAITDDFDIENPETFNITLSNATGGATIGTDESVVTITDNDSLEPDLLTLEGGGDSLYEDSQELFSYKLVGEPLSKDTAFNISLLEGLNLADGDDFSRVYYTKDGDDTQYEVTLGDVTTITAGSTNIEFFLELADDSTYEIDEKFGLVVESEGVTITDNSSLSSIYNDDAEPTSGVIQLANTQYIVDEDAGVVTITVQRVGGSEGAVSVDYATIDGSAKETSDYKPVLGTLNWADGDMSDKSFTINITDDMTYEDIEDFIVNLSNVTGGAALVNSEAMITIKDDNSAPLISDLDTSAFNPIEGAAELSQVVATFSVSDSEDNLDLVELSNTTYYSLEDLGDGNYQVVLTQAGVDKINAGEDLPDFKIVATDSEGAVDEESVGVTDTYVLPQITIDGDYVVDEDAGTITYTVKLSHLPADGQDVSIDYRTSDGSAEAGSDYTGVTNTLTWDSSSALEQTFTIAITDDTIHEGSEDFSLVFDNIENAKLQNGQDSHTIDVTIVDNDTTTLTLEDTGGDTQSLDEDSGTPYSYTLSLPERGLAEDTTLRVSLEDLGVEHQAGIDDFDGEIFYTIGSGTPVKIDLGDTITLPKGSSDSVHFTLYTDDDNYDEEDESFKLKVESLTSDVEIENNTEISTIVDNDEAVAAGTISLKDTTYEIDEDAGVVTITVQRVGGSEGAVSVDYTTSDDTATAGSDYTSSSGTLSWSDGDSSDKSFTINITNDTTYEDIEDFIINLSNATGGAVLGSDEAQVSIIDNDNSAPVIGSLDTTMFDPIEGEAEVDQIVATFSVSDNQTEIESVELSDTTYYSLEDLGGGDYKVVLSQAGADKINAGEDLPDFKIVATDSDGATKEQEVDPADTYSMPTISFGDMVVDEDAGTITYIVTLSESPDEAHPIELDYQTIDGSATAGEDYTQTSGTLSWDSSSNLTQTITIDITDDMDLESDESFHMEFSSAVNATLPGGVDVATADITIKDSEDETLILTGGGRTKDEGEGFGYDLELSTPQDGLRDDLTLKVSLDDLLSNSANVNDIEQSFYRYELDGVKEKVSFVLGEEFTIPKGAKDVRLKVVTKDDDIFEGDEELSFVVESLNDNITIEDRSESYTIKDNDEVVEAGTIHIDKLNYHVDEDAGVVEIYVHRVGGSSGAVSVDYATSDGSAEAGSDYAQSSGTLEWSDGDDSYKVIKIDITDDNIAELLESFQVDLSNATGGVALGDSTATIDITDNDDATTEAGSLGFTSSSYEVNEGEGTITITVQRVGGSSGAVSVDYATSDGSATVGDDYTATSGTLEWADGDMSNKSFTISIEDDDIFEYLENFNISLSNPTGGSDLIDGKSTTEVSIVDNDSQTITFVGGGQTLSESSGFYYGLDLPEEGLKEDTTLIVSLADIEDSVNINDFERIEYTIGGGTYKEFKLGEEIIIPQGTTSDIGFRFVGKGDGFYEESENLKISVESLTDSINIDDKSKVSILDNLGGPVDEGTLHLDSINYIVDEDAGTVTILVNRVGGSEGEISVDYRTSDISATKGSDYAQSSGTLSWSDGDSTPKEIVIDIYDDNIEEILESFKVELLDPMGGAELGDREAVIEIVDNDTDTLLTLTGGDISVDEGGEFIYNLSMPSSGLSEDTILKVSLDDFSIANRYDFSGVFYKIGGGDYQEFELGGEITIPQGTSEGIEFKFVSDDDTAHEGNENFDIKVESLTGGVVVEDTTSVSTILDGSDTSPSAGTLHLDKINYTVDEEGRVTILVNRIGGSEGAISVEYKTVDGSAESGSDYTSKSGTLTWEAGDTSAKKIKIAISEDDIFELLESFEVELSNPTGGAALGDSVATIDIVDNDALILTNESELSKFESHSGSETIFTYGLSTPEDGLPSKTEFTISLDDLSTVEMQDFDRVVCRYNGDQTLEIELGREFELPKDAKDIKIDFVVAEDTLVENSESFNIVLDSSTDGVNIDNQSEDYTIKDVNSVDTLLTLTGGGGSKEEDVGEIKYDLSTPEGGLEEATTIKVSLADIEDSVNTKDIDRIVYKYTIDQKTEHIIEDFGEEFEFPVGAEEISLYIKLKSDNTFEKDEQLSITVESLTDGTVVDNKSSTHTVLNDDTSPAEGTLHLDSINYIVDEDAGKVYIQVHRMGGDQGEISVEYKTIDGDAKEGSDYKEATGTLEWADGDERSKTIEVDIINDDIAETLESFKVKLFDPTGGAVLGDKVATIDIADDSDGITLLTVTGGDESEVEGNSIVYDISTPPGGLKEDTVLKVSLDEIENSINQNDISFLVYFYELDGEDLNEHFKLGEETTIPQGATNLRFGMQVSKDTIFENDEYAKFVVESLTDGTQVANNSEVYTVLNDDESPDEGTIHLDSINYRVDEDAGTVTILVNRLGGSEGEVSVDFTTLDTGSARSGGYDYTTAKGTLTWIDGDDAAKEIVVDINDDSIAEVLESFKVELSNPTGGVALGDKEAVIDIVDNDSSTLPEGGAIGFSNRYYIINEDEGVVEIIVSRVGDGKGEVSVDYATSDGSADAPDDYTATSGTLTWADGDMSDKRFTIDIEDMDDLEALERFNIKLSNLESEYDTTFVDGRDSTKVYIQDNVAPEIEDIDSSMFDPIEGRAEEGDIVATFRVTDIDGNLDRVAVTPSDTYRVINIEDDMYQLVLREAGASLINSGGDLGDIHITAYDTFEYQNSIDLEAPDTYTMPQITLSDATINEDDGTMTYIVTLSKLPDENHPVELTYQTSDGSATAGDDYTSVSGDISWDHNSTDLTYTIEVPILSDDIVEDSEIFNIDFSFKDEDIDFVEFTDGMSAEVTIEDSGTTTLTLTNSGETLDDYENLAGEGYKLSTPPGGLVKDTVLKVSLDEIENSINQNDIRYCKYYYELNSEMVHQYFNIGEESTIPKGATNIRLAVQIQDDEIYEHDEYILIKVDSLTDGTTINHDIDAYKVINDDDARKAGTLHLDKINYTVDEDAGEVVILVNRLGGTTGSASVYYETSDDSATEGSDYGSTSGRLTWGHGDSSSKEIRVPIIDDNIEETLESFKVTLSDPRGGARLGDSEAVISIKDNDDTSTNPGEISLGSSTYTVDEDAGSITINVTRSGGSYGEARATIDLSDITALAGSDYTDTNPTLTWANGESGDKTFTISILDDSEVEGDETFKVELSSIEGANEGDIKESTVTITDNDSSTEPGKLSFSSTQYEVNEDDNTVTITVQRTGGSDGEVSVEYETFTPYGYEATPGEDYTKTIGTLTWADGDGSSKSFTIPILDDSEVEGDERFRVRLQDPTGGAELGTNFTTVNITDDDDSTEPNPGELEFTSGSYSVNEDANTVTITVQRTGGSDGAASVEVSTYNGSAEVGSDYTAITTKTLNWSDGDGSSKSFTIPILDDSEVEGDEYFGVSLNNATGATLGSQKHTTVNITDNDSTEPNPGELTFSAGVYAVEEDVSSGYKTITVKRVGGSDGAVSVEYSTYETGSAEEGEDYRAVSGRLTWADGDSSDKTFQIPIIDDSDEEGMEQFNIKLDNATGGATIGSQRAATVNIYDDDDSTEPNPGELTFSAGVYAVEEDVSSGYKTITVKRVGGSDGAVSVEYYTYETGSAEEGEDYRAVSGTLTWADGDSSDKTFQIPIIDDSDVESMEQFNIKLDNATGGATIGSQGAATVNIYDDDDSTEPNPGVINFTSARYDVDEDDGSVTITLRREEGSEGEATATISTEDITALAGSDYTDTDYTFTWNDGESGDKSITIPIIDDSIEENQEEFRVKIDSTTGASMGDIPQSLVAITDNDTPTNPGEITFASTEYEVNEDNGTVTITVQRTGGSDGAATATISTEDITALAGSDYTDIDYTFTWNDGESGEKSFDIAILDDTVYEGNEKFQVTLDSTTGAAKGDITRSEVTIVDNESQPEDHGKFIITPASQEIDEDVDPAYAYYTVSRENGSDGAVSVSYKTKDGTTEEGKDYVKTTGTLYWEDGDTSSKTIQVPIINDNFAEDLEYFDVKLHSPTGGATIKYGEAKVHIRDDDDQPGTISLEDATYTVDEDAGTVTVTLKRTNGSDGAVSVDVYTEDDSATAGSDYTAKSKTISWSDGDDSDKSFKVNITDDTKVEGLEKFLVKLQNPTGGAQLGTQNEAKVSIIDNDSPSSPEINTFKIENNNSEVLEGFVVSTKVKLEEALDKDTFFTLKADNKSLADLDDFNMPFELRDHGKGDIFINNEVTGKVQFVDYDSVNKGILIPKGWEDFSVSFQTKLDALKEGNEEFDISFGDKSDELTILNNEPYFMVHNDKVQEGNTAYHSAQAHNSYFYGDIDIPLTYTAQILFNQDITADTFKSRALDIDTTEYPNIKVTNYRYDDKGVYLDFHIKDVDESVHFDIKVHTKNDGQHENSAYQLDLLLGDYSKSAQGTIIDKDSPLILDLDGDGVETTHIDSGVKFDIDGDGDLDQTGWVDEDDALLSLDLDGDGVIDDGSELFGNHTKLEDGTKADNGFMALDQYDDNLDGIIDENDAIYSELTLWRDSNQDGKSDEGELLSLKEAGVKSLNLEYEESDKVEDGNEYRQVGSYENSDGESLEMSDVWFQTMELDFDEAAQGQESEQRSSEESSQSVDVDLEGILPDPEGDRIEINIDGEDEGDTTPKSSSENSKPDSAKYQDVEYEHKQEGFIDENLKNIIDDM